MRRPLAGFDNHAPSAGPRSFASVGDARADFAGARSDTALLLSLATELGSPVSELDDRAWQDRVDAFLIDYRTWILSERELSEHREAWAERHSILLHLMVSGSTLGEAIRILTRFAEPVWGATTRFRLDNEGRTVFLLLEEPVEDDVESLVSSIWLLSSTICQLEFLVGGRIASISGQVCQGRQISGAAERLLFGRPLEYGAAVCGVRMSRIDTHRPVTASAAMIPPFLDDYMRLTVNLERSRGLSQIVATIIRRGLNGRLGMACRMPDVAEALGMSMSTLRRRLDDEGYAFQTLRTLTADQLVKRWLRETNLSIEQIAANIGYSDGFALRRAFLRANACSPLAFRRRIRGLGEAYDSGA